MPLITNIAVFYNVQKGCVGGGVQPMFKKTCRICNDLTNALVNASNRLVNVQGEGEVGSKTF